MCAVPKKRKTVSLKTTAAYANYKKQGKGKKKKQKQPKEQRSRHHHNAKPTAKVRKQSASTASKAGHNKQPKAKVQTTARNAKKRSIQAVNAQKARIKNAKNHRAGGSGFLNLSQDIGIDLGTTAVKVFVKGRGMVFNEPSVVALDQNTGEVVAVGNAARSLLGKTEEKIEAICPINNGVIADYEVTEKMLQYFIEQACGRNWIVRPRIMVCLPSDSTKLEEQNIRKAALQSGARQAFAVNKTIAAALGVGVDIHGASGNLIVDIGGGTTDIAVIALDGIVCGKTIRIGGNTMNEAIIKQIRREHELLIGEHCAEDIKCTIGTAIINDINKKDSVQVKGQDMKTGKMKTITFTAKECRNALAEQLNIIIDAINETLEFTSPELMADIIAKGIILTGGGSRLNKIAQLISKKTLLHVSTAENPECSVVLGTGKALEMLGRASGISYFARRKI